MALIDFSNKKTATRTLWGAAFMAIVCMHRLALQNGTLDHQRAFDQPGAYLPNTKTTFNFPRTGLEPVDKYISLMLAIFWVDLDPRNVVPHSQGTHFLGTLSAAWILMLVEAHRIDASKKFIVQTYVIETVAELIGIGFFTPLWCILQLSSLPASKPRTISQRDSIALPIALALGHFLPTAMMILCKLDGEGWLSQQSWILLRLFHPVFSFVIWQSIRWLCGSSVIRTSAQGWYTTAIIIAVMLHTVTLAPFLMTYLAPGWVVSNVSKQLSLSKIFVPAPFWHLRPAKVASFEEGVSTFLRWDEFWGETAICVWAFSQYLTSRKQKAIQGQTSGLGKYAYFIVVVLLGGPAALAAVLMQECDRTESERQILSQAKIK